MVARMESQKPRLDVPKNLVQQMAEKTDAELLAMLDVPEDWTPEAFAAMTAEARNRNLTEVTSGIGGASIPKVAPVREGVMCGQHSQVQATQQCRRCGAFMCATCDFEFPNNLHLCPACACKSEDGLDPRRKKFVIWSMALAAWTSLGMACLISGALRGLANSRADAAVLGYALLLFVLGPGLTGLTLGLSAKYQRRANPPSIWIAIAWNAILVASFIILMIIGIARS